MRREDQGNGRFFDTSGRLLDLESPGIFDGRTVYVECIFIFCKWKKKQRVPLKGHYVNKESLFNVRKQTNKTKRVVISRAEMP